MAKDDNYAPFVFNDLISKLSIVRLKTVRKAIFKSEIIHIISLFKTEEKAITKTKTKRYKV